MRVKVAPDFSRFFHEMFSKLLVHNIRLNGLYTILFCHGLSASRYIEYASALAFFSELDLSECILELGCGHSILPTFWEKLGFSVVVIDINRDALMWQRSKSKEIVGKPLQAILADGEKLPFKDEALSAVCAISTIEHFTNDGDIRATYEARRVLKPDGLYVTSFPLSSYKESFSKTGWASGMPSWMKSLLESFILVMLKKFKVDRSCSYFERMYGSKDVRGRIIMSSGCMLEDCLALRSGPATKFFYDKIIPTGVLTPLEYVVVRFLTTSRNIEGMDAVVLKLRKSLHA